MLFGRGNVSSALSVAVLKVSMTFRRHGGGGLNRFLENVLDQMSSCAKKEAKRCGL